MAKSQHAFSYKNVPILLRELRKKAGMTQRQLSVRLRRPQPWVHKSEWGERRIDISEFLEWCIGCGIDPEQAFHDLVKKRH
jgi:transcriptional regulator with XRE-family HTH domain